MITHDFAGLNSERVTVEAFLRGCLRREAPSLLHTTPDWTYAWEGESWFVEITRVSLRYKDHNVAYLTRLANEPAALDTVPSSSGTNGTGAPFPTSTVAAFDESAVAQLLRDAIERKGPRRKRYGNQARTHLVIDASGDRVDGEVGAARILSDIEVPTDYPYAGVFVWFSVGDDWSRVFLPVRRRDSEASPA